MTIQRQFIHAQIISLFFRLSYNMFSARATCERTCAPNKYCGGTGFCVYCARGTFARKQTISKHVDESLQTAVYGFRQVRAVTRDEHSFSRTRHVYNSVRTSMFQLIMLRTQVFQIEPNRTIQRKYRPRTELSKN